MRMLCTPHRAPARRSRPMAGKVGCGLLLAVLFAVAAVSRAPFAVFLLAWAVLVVVFLAWYARTLRRDVTATLCWTVCSP